METDEVVVAAAGEMSSIFSNGLIHWSCTFSG